MRTLICVAAGLVLAACGGGGATSPTTSVVGFEGRWTGSTVAETKAAVSRRGSASPCAVRAFTDRR